MWVVGFLFIVAIVLLFSTGGAQSVGRKKRIDRRLDALGRVGD